MNPEKVSHFQSLTGSDAQISEHYLEAHKGDLNLALETFYRDQEFLDPQPPAQSNIPQPSVPKPSTQQQKPSNNRTQGSIRTLSDFSSGQSDDDDSEKQNYYTGGEKSGQLVQAPKVPVKVEDIFDKARQHGASVVDEGKKENFSGSGFRLGSAIDQPSQKTESSAPLIITFWKNGFQVGDSPLRSMTDPANQDFLQDIGKGVVPRELESAKRGISVHLVQKEEDYIPPKTQPKAFSGSGQALGSGSSASSATSTPAQASQNSYKPKGLKIDDTRPITTLQIRLHDGTRLVARFNHHHTVQDICDFIEASQKLPAGRGYQIMTTFPKQTITNRQQTIEEAKLLNAVIVQSLL